MTVHPSQKNCNTWCSSRGAVGFRILLARRGTMGQMRGERMGKSQMVVAGNLEADAGNRERTSTSAWPMVKLSVCCQPTPGRVGLALLFDFSQGSRFSRTAKTKCSVEDSGHRVAWDHGWRLPGPSRVATYT